MRIEPLRTASLITVLLAGSASAATFRYSALVDLPPRAGGPRTIALTVEVPEVPRADLSAAVERVTDPDEPYREVDTVCRARLDFAVATVTVEATSVGSGSTVRSTEPVRLLLGSDRSVPDPLCSARSATAPVPFAPERSEIADHGVLTLAAGDLLFGLRLEVPKTASARPKLSPVYELYGFVWDRAFPSDRGLEWAHARPYPGGTTPAEYDHGTAPLKTVP